MQSPMIHGVLKIAAFGRCGYFALILQSRVPRGDSQVPKQSNLEVAPHLLGWADDLSFPSLLLTAFPSVWNGASNCHLISILK